MASAGVQAYVQSIINSIEFIRSRTAGLNVAASTIQVPIVLDGAYSPGANWAPNIGGSYLAFASSAPGNLFVPVRGVPQGCTIKDFSLVFSGAPAHAGLPAVMPVVSLVKLPRGTGALPSALGSGTVVETMTDPSGTVANFQNIHFISKTLGTPELYDTGFDYYFKVAAESGANALTGAQVWSNGFVSVYAS